VTITLTIELSDELEQQVMVQAKQQQVSPESIVVQSLNQSFCFLDSDPSQNTLTTFKKQPLTSLAELRSLRAAKRSTQSRAKTSSLETLQQLRDEERY